VLHAGVPVWRETEQTFWRPPLDHSGKIVNIREWFLAHLNILFQGKLNSPNFFRTIRRKGIFRRKFSPEHKSILLWVNFLIHRKGLFVRKFQYF
jgi:hypothetical protein